MNKVLTLWQPWAWLIANGYKKIETRSWETNYRGKLLIHAAKRQPDIFELLGIEESAGISLPNPKEFDYGGIVAECTLINCLKTEQIIDFVPDIEKALGNYSKNRFGWFLSEVKPLPFYPCKGNQGVWSIVYDPCQLVLPLNC